jgi:hypothetical protein
MVNCWLFVASLRPRSEDDMITAALENDLKTGIRAIPHCRWKFRRGCELWRRLSSAGDAGNRLGLFMECSMARLEMAT